MKYIGYYDIDSTTREKRYLSLAARNKMSYIAETISEYEPVEIISPSGVMGKIYDCGRVEKITDKLTLRLFFSLGRKNIVIGKSGTLLTRFLFLCYLATHIKKGETVIAYHSLGYCKMLYFLKKLKAFRLILEVEELYGDVTGNKRVKDFELQLAKQADGYIFPTKLLSRLINTENKPEVIIHGTYQAEKDRKCNVFNDNPQTNEDGVIHVVYAGTLDPRKGGAAAAAATAEFLPKGYHIHILGFGSDSDIQNMKDTIADISSRAKAKVSYDGVLTGEDYIRFIQSCDIGLSTQNPDAPFNDTSFPSKILSYLANGLRVVSIRIPAIETSAISYDMYYYNKQTPKEIANAIKQIDINDYYNGRKTIEELNDRFKEDILQLLNKN